MPHEVFEYVGGWQKFVVPTKVEALDVLLKGGASGLADGGSVQGRLNVKPGQTLWIMVGQKGRPASGSTGGEVAFGGGGRGGTGNGGDGGDGGGGASYIRMGSKTGTVKAVAGGAGGTSGDGGKGGAGGDDIGDFGTPGTAGTGVVGNATGGTQTQPGMGGTSSSGTNFNGAKGANQMGGRGGAGGGPNVARVHGGGGGGGGFRPGGGGQAASIGNTPGGGGGGGSNYVGGLTGGAISTRAGGANEAHGSVRLDWISPPPANQPPSAPSNVKIEGKDVSAEQATKAGKSVELSATVDDPEKGQEVRLHVRLSDSPSFSRYEVFRGTFGAQEKVDSLRLTGLSRNTLYFVRVYAEDDRGQLSKNYKATSFWTNRPPTEPTLSAPGENSQYTTLLAVPFVWNHHDPDGGPQGAFQFHYRRAGSPSAAPGSWSETVERKTSSETWTVAAGVFKGNSFYEWTVRTQDEQGDWGPWAATRSFYVTADATPPRLLSPINGAAIRVTQPTTFRWRYTDPDPDVTQTHADLRYRIYETGEWHTLYGDTTYPGTVPEWVVGDHAFGEGLRYEWQVRTYTTAEFVSDWSDSQTFWGTNPGSATFDPPVPTVITTQPPLGIGHNRVYVYDRGGLVPRGEITPCEVTRWGRSRDDISIADIKISDISNVGLLSKIRSLIHEIVIFRDGVRVWEGPITRITYPDGGMQIEARDVMFYAQRRIMRQGYNDAYRLVNGQQIGLRTVVDRAALLVMNCLAYDDPNVLPYLTPIYHSGDARQSRSAPDYSRLTWEEIDDLAATAGLDYTTVGRRILLWDTHNPIGRLPEMRDGDFSTPPVITEYGLALANHFGVTNNSGVYGTAERGVEGKKPLFYGWVEQLASAYGESVPQADTTVLTRAAKEELSRTLSEQADRNIANRWPTPVQVRIPDNSNLNPTINLGINQLVPGVWIPLRATHPLREISQWQKLDSMTVEENDSGEKISVVMSPAPNGGEDPDAEQAALEDAG